MEALQEEVIVFLFGGGLPMGRDISECMGGCSYDFRCISNICENCPFNPKNGGDCKLWKRIKIAEKLESLENIAVVPIVFEVFLYKAYRELKEEGLLKIFVDVLEEIEINRDLDKSLIIVIPESPGSIAEFVYYSTNIKTRNRVRAIVEEKYNPLYSEKISYLSAYYLKFAGETGHLYYIRDLNDIDQLAELVVRIVIADLKSRIIRKNSNNSIEDNNYRGD